MIRSVTCEKQVTCQCEKSRVLHTQNFTCIMFDFYLLNKDIYHETGGVVYVLVQSKLV